VTANRDIKTPGVSGIRLRSDKPMGARHMFNTLNLGGQRKPAVSAQMKQNLIKANPEKMTDRKMTDRGMTRRLKTEPNETDPQNPKRPPP
jgi:hypothetical protein